MADPAAAAAAIPALDDTFGVMFIGVVIAGALWGVSCVQAYIYWCSYPGDSLYLKALVAGVWALDTVHQIFITHTLYVYLISNYFNPLHLTAVVWTLIGQVVVAAVEALIVQSFFGLRAFRLSSRNFFLGGIIGVLIVAEFVASIIFSAKSFQFTQLTEAPKVHGLSITVNALAAAGDVAIAGALGVLLTRSKTGFQRSDSLIATMVNWSIRTGFVTSVCAIGSLIAIIVKPNGLIYTLFYFVLARMYCNSFLATLNGRNILRAQHLGASAEGASLSLQEMGNKSGRRGPNFNMSVGEPQTLSIKVDSETTTTGFYTADQIPSEYGYKDRKVIA